MGKKHDVGAVAQLCCCYSRMKHPLAAAKGDQLPLLWAKLDVQSTRFLGRTAFLHAACRLRVLLQPWQPGGRTVAWHITCSTQSNCL